MCQDAEPDKAFLLSAVDQAFLFPCIHSSSQEEAGGGLPFLDSLATIRRTRSGSNVLRKVSPLIASSFNSRTSPFVETPVRHERLTLEAGTALSESKPRRGFVYMKPSQPAFMDHFGLAGILIDG